MNFIDQLTAKVGEENVAAAVLALEGAGVITVDHRPDGVYIEASPELAAAVRGTTAEYWKQCRDRAFRSIPDAIRA